MYVTRPLSMYLRDPSALSLPPPEGSNSGILVIQDEESVPTFCFGLFKSDRVGLPFPQNKNLMVRYVEQSGENVHVHKNRVLFIPVINRPLSSNHYYVIKRKGKQKEEAYMNSTEEDEETCCFCTCISDLKPQPLDPRNIYQQFEIRRRNWGGFVGESIASDGFPPRFLRRKGWRVLTSTSKEFKLNEAPGLNDVLRSLLPDFNFPLSQICSTPVVVVGKWYCPFMFIKEGTVPIKEQMTNSTYYEMTLEQHWEQIFGCEIMHKEGNIVHVDVVIECEMVLISGTTKAVYDQNDVADGVMWFRSFSEVEEGERNVGLGIEIVERMKWEQEKVGWVGGSEKQVRVKTLKDAPIPKGRPSKKLTADSSISDSGFAKRNNQFLRDHGKGLEGLPTPSGEVLDCAACGVDTDNSPSLQPVHALSVEDEAIMALDYGRRLGLVPIVDEESALEGLRETISR